MTPQTPDKPDVEKRIDSSKNIIKASPLPYTDKLFINLTLTTLHAHAKRLEGEKERYIQEVSVLRGLLAVYKSKESEPK